MPLSSLSLESTIGFPTCPFSDCVLGMSASLWLEFSVRRLLLGHTKDQYK